MRGAVKNGDLASRHNFKLPKRKLFAASREQLSRREQLSFFLGAQNLFASSGGERKAKLFFRVSACLATPPL